MSKGTNISHIADGQYSVELELDTAAIATEIIRIDEKIADIESQLADMEAGLEKSILELKKTALEKRKEYLENPVNVPVNPTENIWCADLTEDLSGDVGVIEIAGMRGNGFNIQPGYEANAVYDGTRDGKLKPVIASPAAEAYWNWAFQSGWQKWKPSYRYGTITNLDTDTDTCDVALEAVTNPDTELDINQSASLAGVSIDYMDCNAAAFAVDDEVIVKFTDNDWATPVVIGFKEEPKSCCAWTMVFPTTVTHSLIYTYCKDAVVKTPASYCSTFWNNLQFTDAGVCSGDFSKNSLTGVTSKLEYRKTGVDEDLSSTGNLYYLADMSYELSWTNNAIPHTADGMYVRFLLTFGYGVDTYKTAFGTFGALGFDVTKTYLGSGVYYWNVWDDLAGNLGPVAWDAGLGEYINTDGYSLITHAIEFYADRGSGSMTGSINLTMNSLKICPTYPSGAISK